MNDPTFCATNKVRLSYCHLFQPRASLQPGGGAKYSVTILIPKSDVDTINRINEGIQAAINEGVTSKWGGIRPPQPPIPIHDGDGLKQSGEPFGEECRGCYVLTASDKLQPHIVDAYCNDIMNPAEVYSGCYGRVGIRFFAYNSQGKKGIGCGLNAVQKLEDGTPLGGRGPVDPAAIFGGAAPAYPQPQQPAYPQQNPSYPMQNPAYPQQQPAYQPQYPQQPTPAAAPQTNPITGQPMAPGGIMGL